MPNFPKMPSCSACMTTRSPEDEHPHKVCLGGDSASYDSSFDNQCCKKPAWSSYEHRGWLPDSGLHHGLKAERFIQTARSLLSAIQEKTGFTVGPLIIASLGNLSLLHILASSAFSSHLRLPIMEPEARNLKYWYFIVCPKAQLIS